jgi:hypothetical protein
VLTTLIQEITMTINKLVSTNAQAQLLMTVPGISYYSALLILSEIGKIERFPAPSTYVFTPGWFLVCIARAVNRSMAGLLNKAPDG